MIDKANLMTILLLFGIGGTSEQVSEAGGIKVEIFSLSRHQMIMSL